MSTNDPRIALVLDDDRLDFEPGETIQGRYWLSPEAAGRTIKGIELSVGWVTEGKGNEDTGVHHFHRLDRDDGPIDLLDEYSFETTLPLSPLSYEGRILKIRWRVLVRVQLASTGGYWTSELPFHLGHVRWPPEQASNEQEPERP